MYYVNSKPSKNGNYGNPRGEAFDGALILPDELLNDYVEAKGFAYLKARNGIITSVKLNGEAYNAYINSQPEPTEDKESKIAALKKKLTDTDYIACKIAEGAATREEYAEMIAQRQAWRDEINRLENE